MKKIIILIMLLNAACLSIWLSGKNLPKSSTLAPGPKVNSKARIGMDALELREICGEEVKILDADEGPGRKTLILYYDTINCAGTFAFINGKLESIIR